MFNKKQEQSEKKPKQKKVTVEGTEYTLQSVSPTWYYELITRAQEGGGTIDVAMINRELLENVVVEPKVTLDDFDTPGEAQKLLREVRSFLGIGRG